jgi:hypothetical protein
MEDSDVMKCYDHDTETARCDREATVFYVHKKGGFALGYCEDHGRRGTSRLFHGPLDSGQRDAAAVHES